MVAEPTSAAETDAFPADELLAACKVVVSKLVHVVVVLVDQMIAMSVPGRDLTVLAAACLANLWCKPSCG